MATQGIQGKTFFLYRTANNPPLLIHYINTTPFNHFQLFHPVIAPFHSNCTPTPHSHYTRLSTKHSISPNPSSPQTRSPTHSPNLSSNHTILPSSPQSHFILFPTHDQGSPGITHGLGVLQTVFLPV